ncbi:EamA family transporter [Mycolicibacterium chubuense]|uniref:Threonine/homoserine exporter RhtA n=1 Tax=Mycolicibacterium chubuense TaxID=1800 RepID=A0A0J6YNR0_MYCCU|nr:EamA family transporter [Mycolicibacterium chubuense]KMO74331.1 Threonine/homoserine exporter RhtA [Mycolicibacterium chubuense]ORA50637.1 EamA family transporter [Mycolicibacterium chubuense]SPY00150.1 putative permease, DMT superfamily [Mycolicibacterium chubuense]
MTVPISVPTATSRFRSGLLFALGSAFAFGCSGPFAKALMTAGWSPTAAVTARLAGGALAMAVFATVAHPGWLREARHHLRTVVAYGLIPIAGAQLFYFNAVAHLSVGVALLLEYTAPILVVGWLWATTRRRPTTLTLGGVALAVTGITAVLGLVGPHGFSAVDINLVGVGWASAAAVCAACYFLMSEKVTGPSDESAAESGGSALHPITLAAAGLIVGAVTVALLGVSGLMPLTFTATDTVVAGWTTSWVLPVVALALLPTAIAYTLGIVGIARLKPRFASLVGLSEVLFAVLAGWVLLGEAVTAAQAVGGLIVLAGLALARLGDRGDHLDETNTATWPDAPLGELTSSG